MSATLTHSWFMTWCMSARHLRNLARQPWWIAIALVQPVIWLLLFGAVFKATADIPGFAASSYVDYLTPGIVVMTAAFAGGWAGLGVIEDLNRGVIDRFLVPPVQRQALITGRLVQLAIVSVIQSLIVIALGLLVGARFPGGVTGLAVLMACLALLGASLGALSNGMALLARKEAGSSRWPGTTRSSGRSRRAARRSPPPRTGGWS
jgi:ABC-2 type transport system permease protein